ncbi:UDP-N-acetylmuramoylalanyl-D-glutamate--2,6-diaminopimelate ligase [Fictibacillus enclensis]|uniref:UDP-N-acetylmuramoyl-L-alanyl-D-glutamate--2,6-diaminopimelate ligase n=1 Tax=Fictibacillus enclensis TaxID=1017270 RepID=A0A0V8JCT6_9BACL|nr:UDP-N-acetylmuramoyl-L-alanyl-D-glutamate--2,6-diaminopimelate ligase [Fictibacillus enclensis]KSU84982.1 UDP-N-acetylmuramoylalanyl-D-glutamate--2,6-diaminopimelate ligase [Fictibacillus enclensis]SCB88897.1 UDP-N-acetylmuramoylalanyl-D-glutamate--2,6-diaminopimelate ligase [Fictibacillus enclensis]
MELKTLVNHLINYKTDDEMNVEITSIEMDSRTAGPGSLFVCIEGYTVDGHNYARQAVENGASAILAEKPLEEIDSVPVVIVNDTKRSLAVLANVFYDHPTTKLHLIGVTGTNGKTTTSHLIEQIFADAGKRTGMIGTIDMKINGVSHKVSNTTPESLFLQKAFKEMNDQKVEAAVMEVSSHALDMGRVRGCDYDIAVFTNLTQDHLDYHKDMETYLRAKGLLFAQLGNTYAGKKEKIAILNRDDKASKEFEKMTAAQILTYGIEQKSDIMAKDIKVTGKGTTFTLVTPFEEKQVSLKLVGKFSVYNVLAAVSATLLSGIPIDSIIRTMENVKGVPGRFETVDEGQCFTVIVDYAHTPDSLENALVTVKEFAVGKVISVVGCGGDRDRTKRPLMAKIAAEYSDIAIFTSDNPRTEDPEAILQDMQAGVEDREYKVIMDRRDAINYAVNLAEENDIILIAGKGHETYQIIGKDVLDFDDRKVAAEAIGAK